MRTQSFLTGDAALSRIYASPPEKAFNAISNRIGSNKGVSTPSVGCIMVKLDKCVTWYNVKKKLLPLLNLFSNLFYKSLALAIIYSYNTYIVNYFNNEGILATNEIVITFEVYLTNVMKAYLAFLSLIKRVSLSLSRNIIKTFCGNELPGG